MSDEVVIKLPVPPSANRIWRVAGMRTTKAGKVAPRVIKSKPYVAWITEAGWALKGQRPGRVSGPYDLTIVLPKVRIDPDNAIKATSDLLVRHDIIDDDKLANDLSVKRDDAAQLMVVTVRAAA